MSNDTTVDVGRKGGPNIYDFSSVNFLSAKGGISAGSSIPMLARDFATDTVLSNPGGYEIEYFADSEMISAGGVSVESDTSFKVKVRVPGEVLSISRSSSVSRGRIHSQRTTRSSSTGRPVKSLRRPTRVPLPSTDTVR